MYFSHYFENNVLQAFNGNTFTPVAQLYAAAMISDPTSEDAGTEISYPDYARQAITFSAPAISGGGATITNANDLAFPESSATSNTITHFAFYDAPIGGNMYAYVRLNDPIAVNAGTAPVLTAQNLEYKATGNFSNYFKMAVLNLFRGQALQGFTPYIGLHASDPDLGNSELSGGNYARFAIAFGAPAVQPAGQTKITVNADFYSDYANSPWGTWGYTAIHNNGTGGNVVAYIKKANDIIMSAPKRAWVGAGRFSVGMN